MLYQMYLTRFDRVHKIHQFKHKFLEIGRLSMGKKIYTVWGIFPAHEKSWRKMPTLSAFTLSFGIVWRWQDGSLLDEFPIRGFGFKGYAYVPVILAISILYCYGGTPVSKRKDSAIQRCAIRDDGRRVVTHIERECDAYYAEYGGLVSHGALR